MGANTIITIIGRGVGVEVGGGGVQGGVTSDQADGSSFTSVYPPELNSINSRRLPCALCSRRAQFYLI